MPIPQDAYNYNHDLHTYLEACNQCSSATPNSRDEHMNNLKQHKLVHHGMELAYEPIQQDERKGNQSYNNHYHGGSQLHQYEYAYSF
jgi:hypothetical protein